MKKSPAQNPRDTIAAIATAPGRGGIGVVRVSGTSLKAFAQALGARDPKPRHAGFVRFRAADETVIDEGLLLYFPAPASFTGEDVLELQGHGGPVVMQMVLNRCVELGARLAEPGEFSQRAFLNGRMDLAQAEAVCDLIEAVTASAARSALRSLTGEFSELINRLRDELVDLRMLVEATLDFPDEELDFLEQARAFERLENVRSRLEEILRRAGQGAILRNGMRVVLVGRPNVGKSSLLNALAGEERAIVTDIAGTTRDAVRETIEVRGMPIHVIDTAGLRDSDDPVERIGMDRTWAEIARADVILRLSSAGETVPELEASIDHLLPASVRRVDVINKIDLFSSEAMRSVDALGRVELRLSAKTGQGIDLLRDELADVVEWHSDGDDVLLARERHLVALRKAQAHLVDANLQVESLELFAEELRLAQESLCEITGEFTSDDLLGVIFSRFCIGK